MDNCLTIKNLKTNLTVNSERFSELEELIGPFFMIGKTLSSCYGVIYKMDEAKSHYIYGLEGFLSICKQKTSMFAQRGLSTLTQKAFLEAVIREIVAFYAHGFSTGDRTAFKFILATEIAKHPLFAREKSMDIPEVHLNFILNAAAPISDATLKNQTVDETLANPARHWLAEERWKSLQLLSKFPEFYRLSNEFSNHANRATTPIEESSWEDIGKAHSPTQIKMPSKWNAQLSTAEKMMLIKCIRPDSFSELAEQYAKEVFGFSHDYPPCIYEQRYLESGPQIPILIFSDNPKAITSYLKWRFHKFERKETIFKNEDEKNGIYPIGNPVSVTNIQELRDVITTLRDIASNGDWIVVESSKLNISLLNRFQDSLKRLFTMETVNPHFRIWIISSEKDILPHEWYISSIRIFDEQIYDFRPEFYYCFQLITEHISPKGFLPSQFYRKILFNLCLFYSSVRIRNFIHPLNPLETININENCLMESIKFLQCKCAERINESLSEDDHFLKILVDDIFKHFFANSTSNELDRAWLNSFFRMLIQKSWVDTDITLKTDSIAKHVFHKTMKVLIS
jgi:hypothetical protein